MRPTRFRVIASVAMGLMLASALAGAEVFEGAEPVGLDALFESVGPPPDGSAKPPLAAAALDRVIIKLAPEAGQQAHRALGEGLAAAVPRASARDLDQMLRSKRVQRMRRVFRSFEDASGRQIDTARARVQRVREARQRRGGRRLPDARRAEGVADLENYFVIEVPEMQSIEEVDALLSELRGNELVVEAQPDYIYTLNAEPLPDVSYVPDDPFVTRDRVTWSEGAFGNDFPDLYALRNLHVLEGWSLFDTDASGQIEGAEIGPGEGVVVAVVDTGLDFGHPDLAPNLWTNPGEIPADGVDNDGNGLIDDVHGWDFVSGDAQPTDLYGHGTHVSGTIAARANDAIGVAGVAPFARIMTVKGLNDSGSGSTQQLSASVEYAAAMQADVISNSWGGILQDQVIRAAFDVAVASGSLPVAAAGNDGQARLSMPARFESTVSVAAVDHTDTLASFSNSGFGLDLCAPGVHTLSASANRHDNLLARIRRERRVGAHYIWLNGTSMATPHVSGVAAVLMSMYPEESALETRGRLLAGAVDIDAANPGIESDLGAGRTDLLESLQAEPAPMIRVASIETRPLIADATALVEIELINRWVGTTGIVATLSSETAVATVTRDEAVIEALDTGEKQTVSFELNVVSPFRPGDPIDLLLDIHDASGTNEQIPLRVLGSFFVDQTDQTDWEPATILSTGVNFDDVDGNARPDFALGSFFERTSLYRQLPDGYFEWERPNGSENGRKPLFVDIDDDGDRDLVAVGNLGRVGVLIAENDGTGHYTVIERGDSLAEVEWVRPITPIDLEGDGDLDFIGCGGTRRDEQGRLLQNVYVLRNDGSGVFENDMTPRGIGWLDGCEQPLTFDYDDDGDQDVLFIPGPQRRQILYRNLGEGVFEDVTVEAFPDEVVPCAESPGCRRPSTVASGDYDNDGDLDVLMAGGDFLGSQSLDLFRNNADGTFSDVTAESGDLVSTLLSSGQTGTEFFDLENDGDLDIFIAFNGAISGAPAFTMASTNSVFRNEGDGTFTRISEIVFPPGNQLASFHVAMSDYDGDGGIDVFGSAGNTIIERGGLLRNVGGAGSAWLELRLVSTESAPGGYGARVTIEADGLRQVREVNFSPLDISLVHFGLGEARRVRSLEIAWPSGVVQRMKNFRPNRKMVIHEESLECGGSWKNGWRHQGWPRPREACREWNGWLDSEGCGARWIHRHKSCRRKPHHHPHPYH